MWRKYDVLKCCENIFKRYSNRFRLLYGEINGKTKNVHSYGNYSIIFPVTKCVLRKQARRFTHTDFIPIIQDENIGILVGVSNTLGYVKFSSRLIAIDPCKCCPRTRSFRLNSEIGYDGQTTRGEYETRKILKPIGAKGTILPQPIAVIIIGSSRPDVVRNVHDEHLPLRATLGLSS